MNGYPGENLWQITQQMRSCEFAKEASVKSAATVLSELADRIDRAVLCGGIHVDLVRDPVEIKQKDGTSVWVQPTMMSVIPSAEYKQLIMENMMFRMQLDEMRRKGRTK